MGNIMKTRGLPLPGAPGQWASLEEMYYPDGPPVADCTIFYVYYKIERARELANQACPHQGVYLTGPNEVKVLEDELRPESLNGENYLLASFGNCRCASDAKAIRQFDAHARVPSGVDRIALSHETLQLVLEAPEGSKWTR